MSERKLHMLHEQMLRRYTGHANGKQTMSASCPCLLAMNTSASSMSTEVLTATTTTRQHLRSEDPQ
jgi:hypothetical protein